MKLSDLDFEYPEELVAQKPERPTRVMLVRGEQFSEISLQELLNYFRPGDVLVINDSKVVKRRVFAGELEILFLNELEGNHWQVLFPSKNLKPGHQFELPEGISAKLIAKGRPQILQISKKLDDRFFERVAELPLPPYIQKARNQRHNVDSDQKWYQPAWAEKAGSLASPTASLHFSNEDILQLQERGAKVLRVTLHVGLGTFLPVTVEDLNEHVMHSEQAEVSAETWEAIQACRKNGGRVWALGTTVTRTIESVARGMLPRNSKGDFFGPTDLMLKEGSPFHVVDVLMTNFHQPKSTLLALVAGFSSLQLVKKVYTSAIEKKFRLFSYGDLSVWFKN